MIKSLEIQNFKSIKHLKLDCKRINIFIGEPNTGKSNILESIGILSFGGQHRGRLKEFVRFEMMSNLFYDENLDDNIKIRFDDKNLEITFKNGKFGSIYREEKKMTMRFFSFDYEGRGSKSSFPEFLFKFYRFTVKETFPIRESNFLLPPCGENLLTVLMTHKELKSTTSQIFAPFGLKLVFKPQEDKIEVLKQYEDIIISYPYSLISETLQRLIFHLTAIRSNKNSVIAFEEPESHAFPYYTKYLAEIIALDENNNQYFISTHNPYFLLPILEKSPKDEVGVFITYFEDYQTKTKLLSEKEMEEITEIDVFSNLDRFLER